MPEFLLEVGCEEIPAPWLADLTEQTRRCFAEAATDERLTPTAIQAFATPRRLVVRADVAERQVECEEGIWGPSLKVARDKDGAWTGAALGFARKNGVAVDDLRQAPRDPASPGDLYLLHIRTTRGLPAIEALPGVIASVLRGLTFAKRMSWDAWLGDGKGSFPFGRPIRWLVALLGGEIVPFAIYACVDGAKGQTIVQSGDTTFGHRFLPRGETGCPIRVTSFAELQARLRSACVILDPTEREARIRESLARQGAAGDDRGLIEEWRDLVEYPTVVFGEIPRELQNLPREVLETVLVHHQKYIPLTPAGAATVSRFAAVTNTDGSAAPAIVRGMERVVLARLRDASFFFREDMKRPLAERVDDLSGVVFHQGLGSYRDKAERMTRLVDLLAGEMGALSEDEHTAAREAALLAKADLTTLMVREFPELQGVMGAIYLAAQGRSRPNVINAVRWHYHPVSIDEASAPAGVFAGSDSRVFAAVSLADKLDMLSGYFGLGFIPKGSSDPLGLRRTAQGVVRVLLDFWPSDGSRPRPRLGTLLNAVVAGQGDRLKRPAGETVRELSAFLLDRLRYVLAARGFPADEVEAVLGAQEPTALDDPREALLRLKALHRVRAEASEDFEHLAAAFKRARNILGERFEVSLEPSLLVEPAEVELHAAIRRLAGRSGDHEVRLRELATLSAPVDRFFDDVLVMAEDPRVRANRLGLLSQALALFYRTADISKLGG